MESIYSCPICEGKSFSEFLRCNDYTTSHEEFILKKCENCGFVFTSPRPNKEEITRYYQSDNYISHTGGKKNLIDYFYLAVRKKTIRDKKITIKRNSSGLRLLDFGCGTGEFLRELNDNGYQATGVEPSPIARERARTIQAGKIFESLSQMGVAQFDAITLWHVLEHIHDLNETMQQFYNLLTDSGTIFIAVPNLNSHDAQHYQSYWAGFDVPRHLWHFRQTDMKSILQKNGFHSISIAPMKLDAYYISLLSESYKYKNQNKLINLLKALFEGLKSNLSARKDSNYSSLLYIAKK